jgi:CRISPR-associated protein Cmr1
MQANGHFTLTLHVNKQHLEYRPCNDHSKGDIFEAKAALWAWLHFGGIGGRTRRGFGAVSIDDPKDINDLLSSPYIINEQPPEGVPTLAPSFGASIVIQNTNNTAENAWQALASKYKNFRQGDKCGRNPPQLGSHAGRSRWPEPDIIRHDLTGRYQGSPRHSRRNTSVVKAPRGQFGMPIIFQFPQENELGSVTLKPKNAERLASPLILRPIGTVTQAKAMILLLGNRPNLDCIGGGTCMADKVSRISISTYLTQAEANNIKPLQGNTDPLIAFMDFFQK